ncbi:uncharacterized protein LOC134725504 [Mytilus trossulus]|uniref:uncharacterized protein LOC134725504 n=1 Tax=Mytilus trossulus TaxID=6551 RepID=UPI003006C7CF
MSDTNEQSDDKVKGDEEIALHETDPEEKLSNGHSHSKCKDHLRRILTVCIILCLALNVCVLVDLSSVTTNLSQPSDAHASSEITSIKTKESTCVYLTDREYWKSIPDHLDKYCKPKQVEGGDGGYVPKMFQCPGAPGLYIPLLCLCDYNVTCPDINNTKDQTEHYRKRSCINCTAENYCPCQNFGKCQNCTDKKISSLKCLCQPGTNGTYCTKIYKRLCSISEKSNRLENCKNSNNLECFLRLNNHETYICKWKELMNGDYPNCAVSVSAMNMMKGGMPNSEVMQKSEPPQLTTSKSLLWAILLLLVMAVILLAIWEFYGRCQTFIKKCRKKKS